MNEYLPSRGADFYPHLREALAPEYAELASEQIEALIESTFGPGLLAEDLENIFRSIGRAASNVGGAIGNVAKQVAPVVSSAVPGIAQGAMAGSALGPWGMLGGAVLGGVGSALAKHGKGGARTVGGALNTGVGIAGALRGGGISRALGSLGQQGAALPGLARGLPGGLGSPAAGQLLNLLGRPEVMQALQAMMLGALGRQSVQVGSTPVPVGAFTNLLGALANQASAEYIALRPSEGEAVPEYLVGESGEYRCDIANPEARAEVLWELLQQTEASEAGEYDEYEPEDYTEDDMYDALELAEIESELEEEI